MMLSVVCLTSVAYIRSAGSVCGRPAGWRVLADPARLGQPGSGMPLHASVAGLGGAYHGGRPPTACYPYNNNNHHHHIYFSAEH